MNDDWQLSENSISNGAAYADLDLDGDLEIITNNINQLATIYENKLEENNFIQFNLKGKEANRFAIGAKVWVYTDYGVQYQQVSPTRGFMSGSEYTLTFGVALTELIDSVIIRWNTGAQKTLYDLAANQRYEVNEPNEKVESPNQISQPIFNDITSQFDFDRRHRENTFYDNNRENLIPYLLSTQGPAAAVADVNGDGLDDFFIGGAKQQSGVLFVQQPDGSFDKQTQRTWKNDRITEDTDALFFDADDDGDQDLYVLSGGNEFPRGSRTLVDRLYLNNGQGQFTLSQGMLRPKYENGSCVRATDFDQDGDLDLFVGSRSVPGEYGATPPSFLLENQNGKFKDVTNQKIPELSKLGMVTDAIWTDVDQNGFEDLVVVGEWMPVTVF